MGACHSKGFGIESGSAQERCKKRIQTCINAESSKLKLKDRAQKLDNESLPLDNFWKLTHVAELDLSDNKFTEFPRDLYMLASLKILRFSRNLLTTLPEDIHKCQALETLVLDNNKITELTPIIQKLQSLKSLSLENNLLTSLPAELGALLHLQELTVAQNKIAMFPEDMFRPGCQLRKIFANTNALVSLPGSMKYLEHLERLLLGSNKLRALPHDIGNLRRLSDLWVEDNQLDMIPDSMTNLGSLQKLKLANNKLTTLPANLGRCCKLEMLCVENNRLQSLPDFSSLKRLKVLKLTGNKLQTISPDIGNLPALKDLSLSDNLLQTVPPELGNLKLNPFTFSLNGNPLVSVPQEVMDLDNVLESDFPLAQHVCDGLYIGNLGSAGNRRFLQTNSITHIVNLAADGPDAPETVKNNECFRDEPGFEYWSINIADQNEGGFKLMEALREGGCLKFIYESLQAKHRVLCHCHKGVSRSATVCVAYLVEYKGKSLDEAMAMCRRSRRCIKVNEGFMSALKHHYGSANITASTAAAVPNPSTSTPIETKSNTK